MAKKLMFGLLVLVLQSADCYLEFQLERTPLLTKQFNRVSSECMSESRLAEGEYLELCYDKDITYSLKFQIDERMYYISIDLTTPISWIKDMAMCQIMGLGKRCNMVNISSGSLPKKIRHQDIDKLSNELRTTESVSSSQNGNIAMIEGSNQIVYGVLEKQKNLTIRVRNSDRWTKLSEIFLFGLFFRGQVDTLELKQTNFISVRALTPNLNYLCDGAISLRFDSDSQNSFLNEIMSYMQSKDKIISIYLGSETVITIGGINLNYALYGYSGISGIKMEQDVHFGRLPRLSKFIITEDQSKKTAFQIEAEYFAVFTLSASYIALPKKLVQEILDQLSFSCSFNKQGYLQCQNKKQLLKKELVFYFSTASIVLKLVELQLASSSEILLFNVKQSQNEYIILGEPIFHKYYVIMDYTKNSIGFALRTQTLPQKIINVANLVHLITFFIIIGITVSDLGMIFICCSEPCRKIVMICYSKVVEKRSQNYHREEHIKLCNSIGEGQIDDNVSQVQEILN